MRILNIAVYQFTPLPIDELQAIRLNLKKLCLELGLKGTILVTPEGINCFIAGLPESVAGLQAYLEGPLGLKNLSYKESWSDRVPFNRMLVKVKNEIIHVRDPEIQPARFTGPAITPAELKKWIEEGKEFTLLDTRNDYEVRIGTFAGAKDLGIKTFMDFGTRANELPAEVKEKPVVMFCTGGIRCEKASPMLLKSGFQEVYQLEGGILRYFEECGGAHYNGDCFVFDRRVALTPDLAESGVVACYRCQNPVTPEEQRDPAYVYEVSCPYCLTRDSSPVSQHCEQ